MLGLKAVTSNRLAIALAAVVLTLPLTAGPVTYTYTGNDFNSVTASVYTTSDFVSGFFTLASPLADDMTLPPGGSNITPLSFSYTDGVQTYSSAGNPSQITFQIATDASGNIIQWNVSLGNGPPSAVFTRNYPVSVEDAGIFGIQEGAISNDPGAWSVSTTVPEPATLVLAGAGLAALTFRRTLRPLGRLRKTRY